MDDTKDTWLLGSGSYTLVPDASVDELLNDATEWLQYARCLTDLLTETVADAACPDRRRLTMALGAIGVLTGMGAQCAMQAHARMQWDKV